jgi:3-methyl-2-oxobutanoate hydroxymethyltransferase
MKNKPPLVWVTAYDYPTARILNAAQIDAILVGDSAAMAFSGMDNTRGITLEQLLYHTQAVVLGAGETEVIGDLPYLSYETPAQALTTARRFLEVGAKSVKLEGGETVYKQVEELVRNGIKVIGHLGLTPQTILDYKVQGKDPESARRILDEAMGLEKRGIRSLVLECIPATLAQKITETLSIPTIGIGAGSNCTGQVLVFHDLVGLSDINFKPKFLKRYGEGFNYLKKAVEEFRDEVRGRKYPGIEYSY